MVPGSVGTEGSVPGEIKRIGRNQAESTTEELGWTTMKLRNFYGRNMVFRVTYKSNKKTYRTPFFIIRGADAATIPLHAPVDSMKKGATKYYEFMVDGYDPTAENQSPRSARIAFESDLFVPVSNVAGPKRSQRILEVRLQEIAET